MSVYLELVDSLLQADQTVSKVELSLNPNIKELLTLDLSIYEYARTHPRTQARTHEFTHSLTHSRTHTHARTHAVSKCLFIVGVLASEILVFK